MSETRKQTLAEIGLTKMARSVAYSLDRRDEKARLHAIRLGMNITLAGGWEKCQDWSVSRIEEEAARVHREGGATRQATAIKMDLCDIGDASGAMTYSLGRGDRYIGAWDAAGTNDELRDNWRVLIREEAARVRRNSRETSQAAAVRMGLFGIGESETPPV